MKPQLNETKKRPWATKAAGAEAARSLQEELVSVIHGAFEVAVEIAVQEVTKLVGQATADVYEDMRRENESLKQRLQTAEAMLDSAREEERGASSPPAPPPPRLKHFLDATSYTDHPLHPKDEPKSPDRTGDGAPPPYSPDPQQRPGDDAKRQRVSDAPSDPERGNAGPAARIEVAEEASHLSVGPLPRGPDESVVEQIAVKQECDGSACCLDSIKVEEFSPDCMLAVQSKMLEDWKPEDLDIQSQDSAAPLSRTGLSEAPLSTLTANLSPPTDLSSEFPNIFQLAEPAGVPEASPQVYGVHVRTSRNLGHTYTCKYCGQTFHLPSLLRRHAAQCQQKLQQTCQQPVVGNRSRLQLFPPGCSPFRCTVCSREFNRMENLKTHLRIHTGERPYTCSVCSKCFRHSGALTRHFRIHTGEKPYICGQCGKTFRNCGGLKFHQRSHSK